MDQKNYTCCPLRCRRSRCQMLFEFGYRRNLFGKRCLTKVIVQDLPIHTLSDAIGLRFNLALLLCLNEIVKIVHFHKQATNKVMLLTDTTNCTAQYLTQQHPFLLISVFLLHKYPCRISPSCTVSKIDIAGMQILPSTLNGH